MKCLLILAAPLLALPSALPAATLTLTTPMEWQVIQRTTKDHGNLTVSGSLADPEVTKADLEIRIVADGGASHWRKLTTAAIGGIFEAKTELPAGGWYRVEVRAVKGSEVIAETAVDHVGMGEIFVVTGQSNSANHGAEKQETKTGKVATFDGKSWRLANDPQPGASGRSGSFMPPFGDATAERFGAPVGFVACGIGATSVREWLPQGVSFPSPPTLLGRVRQLPGGGWESNGEAFKMLVSRMKQMGPRGFRAVLWHQGESDANQKDPTRTLPGDLYREYLEKVIRDSRHEIGWEAPWFVAQVSYHVPGDETSPDIRAAQAALWKEGVALEGPDTDALKGEFREANGKGVHFSGLGLREHAALWVKKVIPWVEQQLKATK